MLKYVFHKTSAFELIGNFYVKPFAWKPYWSKQKIYKLKQLSIDKRLFSMSNFIVFSCYFILNEHLFIVVFVYLKFECSLAFFILIVYIYSSLIYSSNHAKVSDVKNWVLYLSKITLITKQINRIFFNKKNLKIYYSLCWVSIS